MANPEHLAILMQGVKVWNKWREENPDIMPDISGVSLLGMDLSGVDMYSANLSGTNLSGVNLREANLLLAQLHKTKLEGANLVEANLKRANLSGAYLSLIRLPKANLERANLHDADMSGAYLLKASFIETNLLNADLSNSYTSHTIFSDIDLSTVKGLETISHEAPSTIGIDTLYKSKGNISEVFLRGCGVPDQMIVYARSLTATPIQYYSCFISYSHKDDELAQRIYNDLQGAGVRCWFAPHDMKIGDKIRPVIDESIRINDKLLLILSKHSVQSDWVEHEVEHALDRERVEKKNILFPVRLDEAVMDSNTGWAGNVKRQRHIGDFSRWKDHDAYKAAFDRLLRDLKAGV